MKDFRKRPWKFGEIIPHKGDIKPNAGGEKAANINKELEQLYALTQDAEADLRKLQSKQEYFVINYQESVKIQTSLQQIQQMSSSQSCKIAYPDRAYP